MNEAMNRERDNTMRKAIEEAREYIREHYANSELSVEMLCRRLHMSPVYFSTVFKKPRCCCGVWINGMLRRYRTDKRENACF